MSKKIRLIVSIIAAFLMVFVTGCNAKVSYNYTIGETDSYVYIDKDGDGIPEVDESHHSVIAEGGNTTPTPAPTVQPEDKVDEKESSEINDSLKDEVIEEPETEIEVPVEESKDDSSSEEIKIERDVLLLEDGYFTSKEDVALYIHQYNHLPDNYITKKEAKKLGWEASKGNLWKVTDKKSIGGDVFGNMEGNLPEIDDRYYECDIDYDGGKRNAKRIVFDLNGNIYYTEDHYETFEKLYGGDE